MEHGQERQSEAIDNTLPRNRHKYGHIGREAELQKLGELLKSAHSGQGRFAVISCVSGLGKSHFMAHFLASNQTEDLLVFEERFTKDSIYDPYAPFRKIVEKIAAANPERTATEGARKADADGSGQIARLYALQNNLHVVQQRLLTDMLSLAKQRTILIFLEDAHLGSATAWQFIHYLAESLSENRILFAVNVTDPSDANQPPAACEDILQRMNRERLITRIQLPLFDGENVRKLLEKRFPKSHFSPELADILMEISHGIPDKLHHYLDKMIQQKLLREEEGFWIDTLEDRRNEVLELGHNREQIDEQLASMSSLPEAHLDLLQHIALVQSSCRYKMLAKILKRPRHKILKDLIALEKAEILKQVEEDAYTFRAPAFVRFFQEGLSPDSEQAARDHIITALEEDRHLQGANLLHELAFQYSKTGQSNQALDCLVAAGDVAMENFAFSEARKAYQQATQLISEFESTEHAHLLLKLAWLTRLLADREESLTYYQRAYEISEHRDDNHTRRQVLIHQGLTFFQLNKWEMAIECFNRAISEAGKDERLVQAMGNYGLGNVYLELARYQESREHYELALDLAEEIGDNRLKANVINNLGVIENVAGNRMQAIEKYSLAIPCYREIGDHSGVARTYINVGITHADTGNWKLAIDFYSKSLTVSDQMGFLPLKSIALLNRALALAHTSKLDDAINDNNKALLLLTRLKDDLGIAEHHRIKGIIARLRENFREAVDETDQSLSKYRELDHLLGIAETEHEKALLARAMGRIEEMENWYAQAMSSYKSLELNDKIEQLKNELSEDKAKQSQK